MVPHFFLVLDGIDFVLCLQLMASLREYLSFHAEVILMVLPSVAFESLSVVSLRMFLDLVTMVWRMSCPENFLYLILRMSVVVRFDFVVAFLGYLFFD